MRFSDLYNYANGLPDPVISVRKLADYIVAHHPDIGEVNFYPVEIDPNITLGHILYERERSGPYTDPYTVANIRYGVE